jgi:hypothetical protein
MDKENSIKIYMSKAAFSTESTDAKSTDLIESHSKLSISPENYLF